MFNPQFGKKLQRGLSFFFLEASAEVFCGNIAGIGNLCDTVYGGKMFSHVADSRMDGRGDGVGGSLQLAENTGKETI